MFLSRKNFKTGNNQWHLTMHSREYARLPVAFFVGVHSAFVASFLIAQYDCAVCEKVTIAAEGFALGLLSPLA